MGIIELGAIGELVGGVAVIASMIYVGIQVRQSNDLERTETLRAFARDWSLAVVEPLRDSDSADLIRRGNGRFEDLQETEKVLSFLTMPGVEQWCDLSRAFMSPPFFEHLETLRRNNTPVQMSDAYPAFVATGRA